MTYPSVGDKGPSVGAGGTDTSDSPAGAPTIEADGISVPRAAFHDGGGYVAHGDLTGDTSNAPPTSDPDGDDGLPDIPRYEGPPVSDADNALPVPMVNPSAGEQGPAGGGVNPLGPSFVPGDMPPVSDRTVYPDTTKDIYPR